ncbi:hypothetical protein SLEP1_g489 [Rubroshorea leprosula]|uniref:Uncharacterized protein n=1 Tax=Rubroshorea leprosula TaxID=152421 RepID=A0AAV5HIZ7_9ROSI|nr:hypothetical protein SLEP1_g489 [Rubroshorea leprosula]
MEVPAKQVGMSSSITPPVQKELEAPAKQDGMVRILTLITKD